MKKLALMLPLLASLITLPATASTMPKAEAHHSSFALGVGPSAALDLSPKEGTTIGVSAGLPFLVNGFADTTSRYDIRMMLDIFSDEPASHADGYYSRFFLSALLGVWGDTNYRDLSASRWLGLEAGLAFAWRMTANLTARVNLVPGYNFFGGANSLVFQNFFPPAAGAEIGLRVTPNFEATLGYNGQGDILGLRFRL